jgi:hypothetical protein
VVRVYDPTLFVDQQLNRITGAAAGCDGGDQFAPIAGVADGHECAAAGKRYVGDAL